MNCKPKELLFSCTKKDFEMQVFRAGGKGGQHQNKTSSGVRIIHKESGAVGESRKERSQYQNKKIAFRHLVDSVKFKLWMNQRIWEVTKSGSIDQRVDEMMSSKNLLTEGKDAEGKWININSKGD